MFLRPDNKPQWRHSEVAFPIPIVLDGNAVLVCRTEHQADQTLINYLFHGKPHTTHLIHCTSPSNESMYGICAVVVTGAACPDCSCPMEDQAGGVHCVLRHVYQCLYPIPTTHPPGDDVELSSVSDSEHYFIQASVTNSIWRLAPRPTTLAFTPYACCTKLPFPRNGTLGDDIESSTDRLLIVPTGATWAKEFSELAQQCVDAQEAQFVPFNPDMWIGSPVSTSSYMSEHGTEIHNKCSEVSREYLHSVDPLMKLDDCAAVIHNSTDGTPAGGIHGDSDATCVGYSGLVQMTGGYGRGGASGLMIFPRAPDISPKLTHRSEYELAPIVPATAVNPEGNTIFFSSARLHSRASIARGSGVVVTLYFAFHASKADHAPVDSNTEHFNLPQYIPLVRPRIITPAINVHVLGVQFAWADLQFGDAFANAFSLNELDVKDDLIVLVYVHEPDKWDDRDDDVLKNFAADHPPCAGLRSGHLCGWLRLGPPAEATPPSVKYQYPIMDRGQFNPLRWSTSKGQEVDVVRPGDPGSLFIQTLYHSVIEVSQVPSHSDTICLVHSIFRLTLAVLVIAGLGRHMYSQFGEMDDLLTTNGDCLFPHLQAQEKREEEETRKKQMADNDADDADKTGDGGFDPNAKPPAVPLITPCHC
jgi:hypothetical protein